MSRPPRIEIAPMEERHIAAVSALDCAVQAEGWSEESYRASLRSAGFAGLVALCGGEIVGLASLRAVLDEADVGNVAVAQRFRRQGIARRLMDALLREAAARGVRTVHLEARAGNGAAIGLYRSLGFVQVGFRRGFYAAPPDDAILMARATPEADSAGDRA